jgi:AraC family transcriptional regulator of adaptative response/methylated-DNA-[protein]-cysteine methyltransferase
LIWYLPPKPLFRFDVQKSVEPLGLRGYHSSMKRLPPIKEMERATQERDSSYAGVFFVAVRTTGIFCRPGCAARTPRPENCSYYATAREAIFAGYRPCKRCRPLEISGKPPDWVNRLLAVVERDPKKRVRDADVRTLAIDPARARRYFLKQYGMTFQAYCRGRRMGEALAQIRNGVDLDDVALGNGYDSHSGFRDAFARMFGDAPGRSRDASCITAGWVESPVGPIVVAATDKGICLVEFSDRRMLEAQFTILRKRFRCAIVPGKHPLLDQVEEELEDYFAGRLTRFRVPLDYPGSPFQEMVWNGLLRIPYGETVSYEDLGNAIGRPGAQRAVGHANGLNRISVIIPCHRVVNKDGKLGGYGGGLWRKQYLLDLEANTVAGKAVKDR